MRTIGEILKKTRLDKKISLEEVEKTTRIRKKFLIALEENNFNDLPAPTFTRGFLKNYCEYLGLSSGVVIAIFRRQTTGEEKEELLPKPIVNQPGNSLFKITPTLGMFFIVALSIGIFLFYIVSQYLSYFGKPDLKIYQPKNNLTVTNETIEIKGKTDPEGKLTINEQKVSSSVTGLFSEKIGLNKGSNRIVISVKNKAGRESKKEIRVNYQ